MTTSSMLQPIPPKSNPLRLKQDDTDDDEVETTTPVYQFGPQVAQIVAGALTGDLSSILQGSFNLVPNQQTSQAINGAWGTIAGLTSTTPPPTLAATEATTTAAAATTEAPTAGTEAPTTTTAPETPETPESPVVEEETEETKAEEATSTTESDAEEVTEGAASAPSTAASSNNEDDDDEDADAEAEEESDRESIINENSAAEDNSVFSRSKVLRVI
jgi:outer membrane biosynthesis protein TonB